MIESEGPLLVCASLDPDDVLQRDLVVTLSTSSGTALGLSGTHHAYIDTVLYSAVSNSHFSLKRLYYTFDHSAFQLFDKSHTALYTVIKVAKLVLFMIYYFLCSWF